MRSSARSSTSRTAGRSGRWRPNYAGKRFGLSLIFIGAAAAVLAGPVTAAISPWRAPPDLSQLGAQKLANAAPVLLPPIQEAKARAILVKDLTVRELAGGRTDFSVRRIGPWTAKGELMGVVAELVWSQPFDSDGKNWPAFEASGSGSKAPLGPQSPTTTRRLSVRGVMAMQVLIDLDMERVITATPIPLSTLGRAQSPVGPPPAAPTVRPLDPVLPGASEGD